MRHVWVCFVLAGCMVGPDYKRPDAPAPVGVQGTRGWKISQPADTMDKGAWWSVYHDPELDRLERMVEVSNQTVKQFEAQYRNAVALVAEARAGLFPTVALSPGVTRNGSGGVNGRISSLSSGSSTGGSGRSGTQYSHQRNRHVGPGRLGPHPPSGGEQRRGRPGQRGRSGECQAVGAGDAGHRLFRPARRGFLGPTADRYGSRLPAGAARSRKTNIVPARRPVSTMSPRWRSCNRPRRNWSPSACSGSNSSMRSPC